MMKEINIKYNPYKVETVITIDGQAVKKNSALNIGEQRLQEWVEDLPEILFNECNVREFKIKFHGTILDYEDVLAVANSARNKDINITVEHIPAKEVADKQRAIDEIFAEIKKGPFEELKQKDMVKAFDIAKSSEFPVSVVATMSAGKSTLINALLNQRLMPAKQEACTNIITEIKDNDEEVFRATVYNNNGELIDTYPKLSLEIMEKLNGKPKDNSKDNSNDNPNDKSKVYKIIVEGNIPFVQSEDVSLVLVDTPGPNNSRDPEHQAATYRMLDESSKTLVLYIMNATQLAVNDDCALLSRVAESMKVRGKQSKDRFIFVINKLDEFKQGVDSVTSAIEKVRKYLEDKGIKNPNIYPASALTALDIRTTLKEFDLSNQETIKKNFDDSEFLKAYSNILGFINNPELHLEKYAPLTPSVSRKITEALALAQEKKDIKEIALIHTGIISIESAIRMYVEKYAKTAKIKNIVDTFAKKLESAKSLENTKQEIATNQEKKKEIVAQIKAIKEKLKNGEEAKKFKKTINEINYDSEINATAKKIKDEAQKEIINQSLNCKGKLSKMEAESICKKFATFSDDLQVKVKVNLEKMITKQVQENAERLLKQYKAKVVKLSSEVKVGEIKISPFELISGDMEIAGNSVNIVKDLVQTETIVIEESHWVKNHNKKWYKFWTWFQEDGHWTENIIEEKEFIDGTALATKFFAPIENHLLKNSKNAEKYAKEQSEAIKKEFSAKFDELDNVLNKKLDELKIYATEEKNIDKRLKVTQERLDWLENIQKKIESILAI